MTTDGLQDRSFFIFGQGKSGERRRIAAICTVLPADTTRQQPQRNAKMMRPGIILLREGTDTSQVSRRLPETSPRLALWLVRWFESTSAFLAVVRWRW